MLRSPTLDRQRTVSPPCHGNAVFSFHRHCAIPVLPIATGRPGSSPPRSLSKQSLNAPRRQTADAKIPIASDARPHQTSRGFLPWKFGTPASRVRRSTIMGPPSANLHDRGFAAIREAASDQRQSPTCACALDVHWQRRSDVIRFGKQHVKGGKLIFTQRKGRNRKPKRLQLPILPTLRRIIDASSCELTLLINDLGRAFTDAGVGNKFRDWCDQSGLPDCTAHGLRKAGATIAAENGATAHQLLAIFGWDTLKQAQVYTKPANRLAENSMHLIKATEQHVTESGPTFEASGTFSQEP